MTRHGGDVVRVPIHFESFYRQLYPKVVAMNYAMCGSRAAAEDIAQEAFLKAHRDWSRVGTFDRPDSWVYRVASNLAISRYRRARAEARALLKLTSRSPEPIAEMSEPHEEFWREVRRLPAQQTQVIALHYLEDRPVAEIAAMLGIPEGTVKSALSRGRAALASRLREEVTP